MNLDNDYDDDGNNIVPCPICLSKYCPSKEDGKEDMFALEAEIRLLLDEYKATYDNSRIANVLEAVEKLLTSRDTYWKERVRKEYQAIKESPAYVNLMTQWGQLDEDGICIAVSRQALEETTQALDTLLDNLK